MTGRTKWYRRAGAQLALLLAAVTVAGAALGGPALWADVPRTDADLRLRDAQGGPPARMLAAAADHALASGSAELDLSVNDFQYVHGDRKRARATWGGGSPALEVPSMSRWLVNGAVYAGPAGSTDGQAGYGAEWNNEVESHDQKQLVVLPWYLNALCAEGKARKVGQESVRGRPATHYRSTVAVTAVDEIQQRTFPGTNGRVQTIPIGNGVHVAHLDAWLDERGRLVRLHTRLADALVTMDFRSFGGVPPITLPKGAIPVN